MPNIEERVVGMRFDSANFQKGIKPVTDGLDKLKASLKLDGATKALDELDSRGKSFTLQAVGAAADGVSTKFVALATIGITALSNIVNKAVNAGETIIKSLTVDPVKAGLDEYELKMGSIQTILANTARYNTGLPEVVASLDKLNTYADKTIYNFGDMTKNIGLFTNAGLKIEEATSIIKGFSNESAASGVTAQGAAGAAYQLSQALSAGTVRLMDWRSLTNVGLGNKNMQGGILEIATAMDTFKGKGIDATEAGKDFNGSLEKGWLTADVMSNYLKIMSGDMSKAEQAQLGLSDATIKGFAKQQKTAEEAATKVRTYSQLIGTMQESVGSGWSQSFDIIVGDFNEATKLFTNVNNSLGGIIGDISDRRNAMLTEFVKFGGRDKAINAVSEAFKAVLQIIKPIQRGMQSIFPPVTGKQLADIVRNLRDFIKTLQITGTTSKNIERTTAGFFAVLSIGYQIISGLVRMLVNLFTTSTKGAEGILDVTGNMGDFLVSVDKALKEGEGLNKFFTTFGKILQGVVDFIKTAATVVGILFTSLAGIGKSGFEGWLENVKKRLEPIGQMISFLQDGFKVFMVVASAVGRFFAPLAEEIGGIFKGIGPALKESLSAGNFDSVLALFNTGILATIGVMIAKFMGFIKKTTEAANPGGGIKDAIKGVFGALTETLGALEQQVKAKTLLLIAAAVGILTLSVVALSMIDPQKLFTALGAISIMFVQLGAVMFAFDKMFTTVAAAKLTLLAAALIGLAAAMLIFSGAVAIMSAIPADKLAVGLVGMAAALGIVSLAMLLLSKTGPGAILGSAALVIAAVGITIIAGALKLFATMSWDDIGRAMATLGSTLAILAVGLTLMTGSIAGSAALVIASVGILVIAAALKVFATLSWDDIGRAMATLGSTLAILAVGLTLMVAALPGAAALVVASVGLAVMAGVLKLFSMLSWEDIGQAMTLLGGTLGILALGLTLMVAALPGAAALLVAAGALAILAPILMLLGSMTWEQIGTGLGALALALGLLAIAGYALIPAIPGLLGLGGAIALIGVGVLAAGLGIAALGVGLTALAAGAGGAVAVIIAAVGGLASLIPFILQQVGLGLIEIIKIIGDNGPAIVEALVTVLSALIEAIITIVPKVVDAIVLLVTKLVNALVVLVPLLVVGGMKLIIGILDGIAKNIGKVIQKGTDVIVALLKGIGKAIPRLLQAGADLIVDFIDGLATAIRNNTARIKKAGLNLADAIIDGMTGGITGGISTVVDAVKNMANDALDSAKKALGIHSPSKEFGWVADMSIAGFVKNLLGGIGLVKKSSGSIGEAAIDSLKESMVNAGDAMTIGMDSAPTIRPVLDLSGVRKEAGLIGGIVNGQSLSVDAATNRANQIAAKYGEYQSAVADQNDSGTKIDLTTNVYSPKAVPVAEVYRQQKSQISTLRGVVEKKNA